MKAKYNYPKQRINIAEIVFGILQEETYQNWRHCWKKKIRDHKRATERICELVHLHYRRRKK